MHSTTKQRLNELKNSIKPMPKLAQRQQGEFATSNYYKAQVDQFLRNNGKTPGKTYKESYNKAVKHITEKEGKEQFISGVLTTLNTILPFIDGVPGLPGPTSQQEQMQQLEEARKEEAEAAKRREFLIIAGAAVAMVLLVILLKD